jgi:hypothetical protein
LRPFHITAGRAVLRETALAAEHNVLTDDRAALDRQLTAVKASHPEFRYLYTHREGKVLAHTFNGSCPPQLLTIRAQDSEDIPRPILDEANKMAYPLSQTILDGRGGEIHAALDADYIHKTAGEVRREVLLLSSLFVLGTTLLAIRLSGIITATTSRMREMMTRLQTQQTVLEKEIDDHIRAKEELSKAKETAEAANRAKSEFLANSGTLGTVVAFQ